jgi:type I restriction enzyme S subunit
MYLLNSPFVKQYLHDNEVNNARANLSLGFFRNLSIPFPQLEKQKKIVESINKFYIETKQLENIYQQKLIELEKFKKSILQKAFNGDLVNL